MTFSQLQTLRTELPEGVDIFDVVEDNKPWSVTLSNSLRKPFDQKMGGCRRRFLEALSVALRDGSGSFTLYPVHGVWCAELMYVFPCDFGFASYDQILDPARYAVPRKCLPCRPYTVKHHNMWCSSVWFMVMSIEGFVE